MVQVQVREQEKALKKFSAFFVYANNIIPNTMIKKTYLLISIAILSWYELIDIYAESMLEEFMDPSAEWRMRKLAEALQASQELRQET